MGPILQRPTSVALRQVLADLTQRQIIHWRHPSGVRGTPLGPLVRCGGMGSADVLVVLAPYGYVLALTGSDGTLTTTQRALLDTIAAAGVVALVVYTQPWCDLLDQATSGRAVQQEGVHGIN